MTADTADNRLVDLSYWNRPVNWPLVDAECVMVRGPIGDRWVDDDFHANWQGARARPRQGVYCDLITGQSGAAQALNIFHQTGADFGSEAVALDVERTKAERARQAAGWQFPKAEYTAMLWDVVSALRAAHPVRLYTSKIEWEAMTTQPEWARELLNWLAHYNRFITAPDTPAGWRWDWWQYGQAQAAGIENPVDVTRERVITMTTIAPGAGHGFHGEASNQIIPIIERGLALGIHYKCFNSVHNPGRLRDAHDRDSNILTVCRFKHPHTDLGERWENGQDMESWPEDEHLAAARASIQLLFDNTNAWERGGIKLYTPGTNEVNLTGFTADWTCLGHHMHLLLDEAERREQEFGFPIRLAIPGIAQGKPEYHQMKQMVATGIFDRMASRGDRFTLHAGRYRWETSDAIPGLGVVIPGAPSCPPYGGSGDGRVNYFYALGIKCRFLLTEAYDGLDETTAPSVRVPRMKQTDDLYRHNPFYDGTCWYECVDNKDSPWADTDFTPTFRSPEFEAEMIREAHVANPTATQGDDEMQPIYHAKALIDLLLRDAAGNVASDPLAQSPDGHVVLKGTTLHVYAAGVTAGGYVNRATVTPDGKSVWGIATALQRI